MSKLLMDGLSGKLRVVRKQDGGGREGVLYLKSELREGII